ncbi:MAG: hypothetical protein QM775_03020 [Pirellulales bacterium]
MENKGVWGVTNAELESAVSAADATAFMVPARIVRGVLAQRSAVVRFRPSPAAPEDILRRS